MKTIIKEYDKDFYIFIEPENIEEARILLCLAKTSKKNNILINTFFNNKIESEIIIEKNINKKFKRYISNREAK